MKEPINYPSPHAIGDIVKFTFSPFEPGSLDGSDKDYRRGMIVSITFTKAKVFYNVLDDYTGHINYNVDSVNVYEI